MKASISRESAGSKLVSTKRFSFFQIKKKKKNFLKKEPSAESSGWERTDSQPTDSDPQRVLNPPQVTALGLSS